MNGRRELDAENLACGAQQHRLIEVRAKRDQR